MGAGALPAKSFESAAAIGCVRLKNIMEMVLGAGVGFVCKLFFLSVLCLIFLAVFGGG